MHRLRYCFVWAFVWWRVDGSVLLSELSAGQLRRLLDVTGKVSSEELSLATPPPTQEYGKFNPAVEKVDFDAVRRSIEEELKALNADEVSKKVLAILQSLSKVSIKGSDKETKSEPEAEAEADIGAENSKRRLNAFDYYGAHGFGGSGGMITTAPWNYNPYAATASPYAGTYGYGAANPFGAPTLTDPWAAIRPMAYTTAPAAYYTPPMVPGLNMVSYRGLASPQAASGALLGMMMPTPLYTEFARATPVDLKSPPTIKTSPASTPTIEGAASPPDIQSLISSMTADMGNTLDLNLINGVANSAATNFRNLINGTQYGSLGGVPSLYPPTFSGVGVGAVKRRLDTLSSEDLLQLLQLLTGASTATSTSMSTSTSTTTTTTTSAPHSAESMDDTTASVNPLESLLSGLLVNNHNLTAPLASDFLIPTPIPIESVTADSVANVWNNYIESLTNTSQQLSLPTLDNYNATLPNIGTVGNAAGLPQINELVGQNLGSSLGSTMGNLASGTASLISSYIDGAKEAFLESFSPNLASLFKGDTSSSPDVFTTRRRLAAVAHKRKLDASTPSCALANTLYRSADAVSFNNVDSLTVCQMICQTYSDAGVYFSNCASPLTSHSDKQCVGASFSEITGRCSIFFTIEDQFTIEGYGSVPLHCDDSTFVQTQSRVNAIAANTNCYEKIDWTVIRTVADSASPTAPNILSVTDFPELPSFVNDEVPTSNIWHYNPDTPVTSTDGDFKDNVIYQVGYGVSNTDGYWGQSNNITDWRYCAWLCTQQTLCTHWTYYFNPTTYGTMRGGCTLATNMEPAATAVSSVQTVSGPRMTQLPVDLFGSYGNTGRRLFVADPERKKWVTAANPPKRRLDSPYVSSIIDPMIMSKYGLRQLEGDSANAASANAASASAASDASISSSNGGVQACEDSGFAYRSLYSSTATAERLADTVTSFVARTPEACAASCKEAAGCVAWQYLPEYTISSDTRLQESQLTTCALLSSVNTGKVPSVPQMISGLNVVGTCHETDLPRMNVGVTAVKVNSANADSNSNSSASTTASSTQTPSSEVLQTQGASGTVVKDGVTNVTTCFDSDGHENHFANGVSIRGRLLSEGNNVRREIESPEKCRQECESATNCTVFSWGQWQGCYLMETVEAFVADTNGLVYSGYGECRDNARNERRRLDTTDEDVVDDDDRSVVTCERAQRGLVYSDGTILAQIENQYNDADSCWAACRAHPDCFYMSYITANEGPSNVCVFFSDVEGTAEVATSVATSAESNCDVLGTLDFESGWWKTVSNKARTKTGAAIGGTVAGCIVIGIAALGGREYSKRKAVSSSSGGKASAHTTFLADLTPSVDGDEDGDRMGGAVSQEGGGGGRRSSNVSPNKRKRNMFGMASPGALERGSPTLHVDDFEKVEPKSTGKRLRRYF